MTGSVNEGQKNSYQFVLPPLEKKAYLWFRETGKYVLKNRGKSVKEWKCRAAQR